MKKLAMTGRATLAAALLFAPLLNEPFFAENGRCTVTVAATGFPGDCFVATFSPEPESNISGARIRLVSASGKTAASAKAFWTDTGGTLATQLIQAGAPKPPVLAAVVAIPIDTKSGHYAVVATYTFQETRTEGALEFTETTPFVVEPRHFPSETVALDKANSAIKQDAGPERTAQISNFQELIASQNADAPRFVGPFITPVEPTTRRTSEFAFKRTYRYSNGAKDLTVHYGIDFGVPEKTPVRASGSGRVVMAENRISTGWSLAVEHAPGIYSLYYHLSELLVTKGALVSTGDIIAQSGSTGLATGPHLHWEFRVNGEAVSPDWFVSRRLY